VNPVIDIAALRAHRGLGGAWRGGMDTWAAGPGAAPAGLVRRGRIRRQRGGRGGAAIVRWVAGGSTDRPSDGRYGSGPILFDPIFAATGESPRIRSREARLGTRLWPLGEWSGEYILLLGEDRRVFAETTFRQLQVGSTFSEALTGMILAEKRPREVTW